MPSFYCQVKLMSNWFLPQFVLLLLIFNSSLNCFAESDLVLESLLLPGDAGNTKKEFINTLVEHAKIQPSKTSVYFLGDNIYSSGLPNKGHPEYPKALERLNRQIQALKGIGSKVVFIPGNHDWDNSGPDGYINIKNQEAVVKAAFGEGSFLPSSGCPGPVVTEERSWVKVIAIDSHWWLHPFEKPHNSSHGCPVWTKEALLKNIKEELGRGDSKKPVVFLHHHPLESVGTHAKSSNCVNNFGCPAYVDMRKKLLEALNTKKPLVCAAGHDHSLQHLVTDYGCRHFIVSGSMTSPTPVFPDQRTKYASGLPGFVRLDYLASSKIRMQIIEVAENQPLGRIAYETILE